MFQMFLLQSNVGHSSFCLTIRSRVLVQEHTDLSDVVVVQVEILQRCIHGCVRPCRAETVTDTCAVAQKGVLHIQTQKDNRCC